MPSRRRTVVGVCIAVLLSASVPSGLVAGAESDGTHMVPLFEGQETQVPRYVLGEGGDRHSVTYFECPLGILPNRDGSAACERVPGRRLSVRFEKLEGSGRVGRVRPRSGANPVTFRAISAGKGALVAEYQKSRRRSFSNRNEVIVEAAAPEAPEAAPDAGAPGGDRWVLRRIDGGEEGGQVGSPMAFRLERCPPEQLAFLAASTSDRLAAASDDEDDDDAGPACEPVEATLEVVGGDVFLYPLGIPSLAFVTVPAREGTFALEALVEGESVAGTTASVGPAPGSTIVFDPPLLDLRVDSEASVRLCRRETPAIDGADGATDFPFPAVGITANDVVDPAGAALECVPLEGELSLEEFGGLRLERIGDIVEVDTTSGPGFAIATSGQSRGLVVAPGEPQSTCTEDHLRADVNRDGKVDMNDIVPLALEWQMESSSDADINEDGFVDAADLREVSLHFGAVCPRPVDEGRRQDVTDWFDPPAGLGGPEAAPLDVGLFIEPSDESSSAPRPFIDIGSYEVIACDRARLASPPDVTDAERGSVCVEPEEVTWQVEATPSGAAIVASESDSPLVIMPLGYDQLDILAAIPQGLTGSLRIEPPELEEPPERFIRPVAAVVGEDEAEAIRLELELCDGARFDEAYGTVLERGTSPGILPDPGPAYEAACEPIEAAAGTDPGAGSGVSVEIETFGDPGYEFLIDGRFVRLALRTRATPSGPVVVVIRLDDDGDQVSTLGFIAPEQTVDCGESGLRGDVDGDRVVGGEDYVRLMAAARYLANTGPSGDYIETDLDLRELDMMRDLAGRTCR